MPEPLYRAHVLCCQGTGCTAGGSENIFSILGDEVRKRGLENEVRVEIKLPPSFFVSAMMFSSGLKSNSSWDIFHSFVLFLYLS